MATADGIPDNGWDAVNIFGGLDAPFAAYSVCASALSVSQTPVIGLQQALRDLLEAPRTSPQAPIGRTARPGFLRAPENEPGDQESDGS
jgi:hypothetical protein